MPDPYVPLSLAARYRSAVSWTPTLLYLRRRHLHAGQTRMASLPALCLTTSRAIQMRQLQIRLWISDRESNVTARHASAVSPSGFRTLTDSLPVPDMAEGEGEGECPF